MLSFTKTQEENGHSALSFVTIDSDGKERLPPRFPFVPERQSPVLLRFVMCWSQLQGSWDNVGPFHIYGSSGEPWLSVRLWVWEERGSVDLWGYFLSDRYFDPFFFTNINSGWWSWAGWKTQHWTSGTIFAWPWIRIKTKSMLLSMEHWSH